MKNKRQILSLLLVTLSITIILISISLIGFRALSNTFRDQQRTIQADFIGKLRAANPELTDADFIRILRQPSSAAAIKNGEAIMYESGILSTDYDTYASQNFVHLSFILLVSIIIIFAVLLTGYFLWRTLREEWRIRRLTDYLQTLKEHSYDLRLAENSEDSLSLLANEVYKLTVLLNESASLNRRGRRQLEDALADISHQLRTPLTSIQIMVDNISDDPAMPPEIRQDFLASISNQVTSMSDLVTTLLHLAKIDNGTIKFHPRTVSFAEFFVQIRQRVAILADLQDVNLKFSGQLDAKLKIDPRWQTEAITNIVKNCIEHSHTGGMVHLQAINNPLFSRLIITDEGDGIDPHELKHIFERFYKASNSNPEGVGIGLAFAKTVIEAENGQVSVKSVVGTGTKFTVTFHK